MLGFEILGFETSLFSIVMLVSPPVMTLSLGSVCTAVIGTVALGFEDVMKTDLDALESGGMAT